MVPDPSKSPVCRLHPVEVWWARHCGKDQRRWRPLEVATVEALPDFAVLDERRYIKYA